MDELELELGRPDELELLLELEEGMLDDDWLGRLGEALGKLGDELELGILGDELELELDELGILGMLDEDDDELDVDWQPATTTTVAANITRVKCRAELFMFNALLILL